MSVVLAAAPGPSLASPDFTTLNVTPETARFCNEHLASQLQVRGLQVTTARQIAAMLGFERQKQLLGCSDESNSCMAELSAALGVDGLLLGDLGRLGTKFQLNLRVVRANGSGVVATWSRSVAKEDDLLDALTDAAKELAPQLVAAFQKSGAKAPDAAVSTAAPPTRRVGRSWPLVPTFIGAGLALAGGIGFGVAAANHGRLVAPAPPGSIEAAEAVSLAQTGEVAQGIGLGGLIGAGVSLGVSLVWYLISGRDEPVTAALAPWGFVPGWVTR